MTKLGLNIKKIRERWKLSQEEFGLLIGATRGMIMQYEKRGTMPKNETVSKIAKVTGISGGILQTTILKDDQIQELSTTNWLLIEEFRMNPDMYAFINGKGLEVLKKAKPKMIESLSFSDIANRLDQPLPQDPLTDKLKSEISERALEFLENSRMFSDEDQNFRFTKEYIESESYKPAEYNKSPFRQKAEQNFVIIILRDLMSRFERINTRQHALQELVIEFLAEAKKMTPEEINTLILEMEAKASKREPTDEKIADTPDVIQAKIKVRKSKK